MSSKGRDRISNKEEYLLTSYSSRLPSGNIEKHYLELDRKFHEMTVQLKSAQREIRKYARRLETANANILQRKRQLQSKVQLKEKQLSEKIKRLSILYEVGHAMSATLELDQLLNLIVKLAARHLKARKASLMLIEEQSDLMKINSSVGIKKWIVEKTVIKVGEGITGMIASTGDGILIRDIAEDKRFKRPSRSTYQTGTFISVPLKRQEKVLGVLNISDKRSQEPFNMDDFQLVKTLAAEAAIAVENATLYERLKEKIFSLELLSKVRERERQQLLTLINSITDGILAIDLENRPLFINAKAKSFLNLPERMTQDQVLMNILPSGEFSRSIIDGMNSALSTMVTRKEIAVSNEGESKKYFEVISLPVKQNPDEMIGALAIIRDITEFKELDQTRIDFLNRASHQLKTPVGLIKGFADTLIRHSGIDEEKRNNFLKLVHSEANRLVELIENLLDFTQIESNIIRVEKEKVSISAFMKELLPAVEAKAAEKQIKIKTSLARRLPVMETDPKCLMEAIRNLLDNSMKYTPHGGEINITARQSGEDLELIIEDNGPGVDESELPHIFDKFYVGKAGADSGTGLGLYIAKEIIDTLGGGITLTSRPGEGTSVKVTLPVATKTSAV